MKNIYKNVSSYEFSSEFLKHLIVSNSSESSPFILQQGNVQFLDSCPIVCHKESLSSLIFEILKQTSEKTEFYKSISKNGDQYCFDFDRMSFPYAFCDKVDYCFHLYGKIMAMGNINVETERRRMSPNISIDKFKKLNSEVNSWITKLKRKGRRKLTKSLTLKPN